MISYISFNFDRKYTYYLGGHFNSTYIPKCKLNVFYLNIVHPKYFNINARMFDPRLLHFVKYFPVIISCFMQCNVEGAFLKEIL